MDEPMIRAVLKKGKIQPLDKIPAHWREGQELFIEGGDPPDDPAEIDKWYRELVRLSEGLSDADHERMEASLAQQKKVGKQFVREQMGLVS
jgi:hypothetical protein